MDSPSPVPDLEASAAKGMLLTPAATIRIVANKKKVAVLAVTLELLSDLRCFISVPSTNTVNKRIPLEGITRLLDKD